MNKLYVYYEDHVVGSIQRNENLEFSFQYDHLWIKNPNNFPISLSIPVNTNIYGHRLTLSYFENLLPEGFIRDLIEKDQNIKGEYDFLIRFGRDIAGALQILPEDKIKLNLEKKSLKQIDLDRVYQAIEEKKSMAEFMNETQTGYLSLAGAQDKFPFILRNNRFYIPEDGSPTTHIAKVPISRSGIKDSVYNEIFCMNLAKTIGLNVPECLVHQGKFPIYVIERYDRFEKKRLHQQDFCQALGFTSEFKYEDHSGPNLKMIYDLIVNHTSAVKKNQALKNFLKWVAFNLIIGNNDCHAKNISFLMINNKLELAPFYDLLSTTVYPKLKKTFCYKIGDTHDFSRMGRKQFLQFENQLGLKQNSFLDVLQETYELTNKNQSMVASAIHEKYGPITITKKINDLIKDRSKNLKLKKIIY